MCLLNNQPVGNYGSPCGTCSEYLNSCMPVVIEGFLYGECDICFCEYCSCYEECCTGLILRINPSAGMNKRGITK